MRLNLRKNACFKATWIQLKLTGIRHWNVKKIIIQVSTFPHYRSTIQRPFIFKMYQNKQNVSEKHGSHLLRLRTTARFPSRIVFTLHARKSSFGRPKTFPLKKNIFKKQSRRQKPKRGNLRFNIMNRLHSNQVHQFHLRRLKMTIQMLRGWSSTKSWLVLGFWREDLWQQLEFRLKCTLNQVNIDKYKRPI